MRVARAFILAAVTILSIPAAGTAQTPGEVFRKVTPSVVVIRAKGSEVTTGGQVRFTETGSGVLISTGAPDPGPETAVIDLETRAFVADAIASLAPVERSVIQLAYGAHLSQVEIAARLGWPLGTVKTRTRRALRHLRDRLVPPSTTADPLDAVPPRSGTCVPA